MKSSPRSLKKLLLALLIALGFAAVPLHAQTVIIGDTTTETRDVPPALDTANNTNAVNILILGNTATGNGTLNLRNATVDVTHAGGYSGFVTVGNDGIGTINQSDDAGATVLNIRGPAYVGPTDPAVLPAPWGGYLFLGRNNGSSGTYTTLGTGAALQLNVDNEIQIGGSNVSTEPGGGFSCSGTCTGTFIQNGGIVTAGGVTIGIGTGVGSYMINLGMLNAFIDLGNTSSGDNTFTQNGGTVNASGMFIANGFGSNGTYTLNHGTLNSGSFTYVGLQGTGTFTQTGGFHFAGDVSLGFQSPGNGTYNLSGGTFNVGTDNGDGTGTGSLLVGDNGVGAFVMTGGTLNINNPDINTNAFVVGNHLGSVGTFTQSGGNVTGGRALAIGLNGGTGTYNLDTDTVNGTIPTLTTGFIALGNNSGQGTFNQQVDTSNTTGSLFIGQQGTYNLDGGSLNVGTDIGGQGTIVGTSGVGALFNQTGGVHQTSILILGNQSAGNGTYNMSAGTLNVSDTLLVGRGDNSFDSGLAGLFRQTGGDVSAAVIRIGGDTRDFNNSFFGRGRYELVDGTVTSQNFTIVGDISQGSVLQTGGTFNAGVLSLGSAGLFAISNGVGGFDFYSSGIYDLQDGILNTNGTTVSVFGLGTFNQSGGTHNVGTAISPADLVVGSQPAQVEPNSGQLRQGIYNLSGGLLSVSGNTIIGAGNNSFGGEAGAHGEFNQSGGTHNVSGNLILAQAGSINSGTGIYNLSGGDLNVTGMTVVGDNGGGGFFTQSGSSTHVTNQLFLGNDGGSGGYELNSGTLTVNDVSYVSNGGLGTFTQNGGTFTTNFLNVGIIGNNGFYFMNGGTLTVNNDLGVGGNGNGTFTQTGGDVFVNDPTFGAFIGGNAAADTTGSYSISAGSLTVVAELRVGENGMGTFNQTGGVVSAARLILGGGAQGVGTYNMSGGTLTDDAIIGDAGTGVFNNSGGTHTVTGGLTLGNQSTGDGTYNLSLTGQLSVQFGTVVGEAGTGLFNQSGTSIHTPHDLVLGNQAGATGTYNMSGGTLTIGAGAGGAMIVGASGTGTFIQTGGDVSVADFLSIGQAAGSTGNTYRLDAGTLTVGTSTIVGDGGSGTFTQNGGTHNTGSLLLGNGGAASNGTYNLVDGALNVTGGSFIGTTGTGTFTQSGGTHTTGTLSVGNNTGGTGSYTLSGGILTVGAGGSFVGASGTGTFDQSSGTHNTTLLSVGNDAGGMGTYNLSGGSLNVSGTSFVGASGNGTFMQTGGTHTANALSIGNDAGGAGGTYNLSAGTLAVTTTEFIGASASGTMNQSGGVHTVGGNVNVRSLGTLSLSGGSLTATNTNVSAGGIVNYSGGTLTSDVSNAGQFNFSGAGTRILNGNLTNSGVVNLTTNAQVNVLNQTGGTINLNTNNLSVTRDYTNSNFGIGNSFDPRAGVTGTGQIVGVGTVQAITGNVTNGTTPTVTLNFGNVRGGTSSTLNYQVANTGTPGSSADLRGAVQNSFTGGGVSDSRLSGAGVTAANFGPIAGGGNSGNLGVTFTANSGGSLSGQSVRVLNNFDNVPEQVINITGFASMLAQGNATPNTPSPISLGNFRVGGAAPSQNFTVANTTSGAGAEQLGIGSATATGNFAATNNLGAVLIAGGGSQANAVTVTVSGGAAGINNGNLAIQYRTDGTNIDPTFTAQNANLQNINVTATGFNVATGNATPAGPINLGNFHVGQPGGAAPQNVNINVTNQAPVAFSEQLGVASANVNNAAFTLTNNIGASLVNGGDTFSNALNVARNGGAAGVNTGTIAIQYSTDGTNTSGLAAINSNSQNITVNATGFRLAQANNIDPINFGNVLVNSSQTRTVSVSNLATADGFSEALNAAFGTIGGFDPSKFSTAGSISQLGAGLNNNASMIVTLNTSAAGTFSANVQILLNSDGTGTSGLGITALPTQVINLDGVVSGTVNNLAQAGPHSPEPVVFGNVRVNAVVPSQALSISNIASAPAEGLNGSIATASPGLTASGSFTSLAAQATDSTSLLVGITTGTAGSRNGTATITLASDGTANGGTQTPLPSQTVNVQGGVFQVAQPSIPSPVDLGNVRIGDSRSQAITIGNTDISPAGFQEGLNATVGGTSGGATGSGTITNLGAGVTSNAISVGLTALTAGNTNSGSVTLNLASNGAGTSGLSLLSLSDATVNVTATGYRTANPVANTGPITLAARVGDAGPTAAISITNSSPDVFTEGLNVTRGATPAGFTSSGSITNLTAGSTSPTAIQVALNTSTAGSFTGNNQGLDFVSTGAGTTGAPDVSVGSGAVSLTGRVYTPAVAQQNTPSVNFGIVHVNEVVATQGVSVTNNAAVTALNDVLRASFVSASSPFTGSGNLGAGLGAQQTDSTSLQVGFLTGTAGLFNGTATFSAASHDVDLIDAPLSDFVVSLTGQVNNFAADAFSFDSGDGTFSQLGSTFTLDFGTRSQGSGTLASILLAGNSALGPADLLDGLFEFLDSQEFAESGFDPFFDLEAGQHTGQLRLSFDTANLGTFTDTIRLHGTGHNASGFSAPIGDIELIVRGTVVSQDNTVPEPATFALLLAGMLVLAAMRIQKQMRARRD